MIAAQKLAVDKSRRKPLIGRRVGKHIVKSGEVDVQLTDELSESLRGLQVRCRLDPTSRSPIPILIMRSFSLKVIYLKTAS